jgi:hypothetical protein
MSPAMKYLNDIGAQETTLPVPPTNSIHAGTDWLRLPKPGHRLEGLSRTTLTELAVPCAINGFKPPIRSLLIKKRGAARGIRLIEKRSLYSYLNRLAEAQEYGIEGRGVNSEVSK